MSTQTKTGIVMGYPDFWPVVLRKYKKFFELSQTLGPTIDDLFSQSHTEPSHTVCRHLSKMVANSVGAVLLLGVNGYGYDGIKIARTMFEAAVTVAYLRKHPDEFGDYFDFHFIVAMQRHRYMQNHAPEHLKRVTPEALKQGEEGYARVDLSASPRKAECVEDGARNASLKCAQHLALRNTI